MSVHCTNPDCPELDVPKITGELPDWLLPVICGECGHPCTDPTAADGTVWHPAPADADG
jgi:hypothetical protein